MRFFPMLSHIRRQQKDYNIYIKIKTLPLALSFLHDGYPSLLLLRDEKIPFKLISIYVCVCARDGCEMQREDLKRVKKKEEKVNNNNHNDNEIVVYYV